MHFVAIQSVTSVLRLQPDRMDAIICPRFMKKLVLQLLAVALAFGSAAISATAAGISDAPWSAQWIGPAQTSNNTWICFRKNLTLTRPPASLRARIAVDSKYWLWINGKLVVFEGGLKRGPTPQDTYFDEVEIGPELKRGNNSIAMLVWYWGKNGFSYNTSGKAGLVFEAGADGDKIVSDASWKMLVHPAYEATAAPYPNYRLPEFNIGFDARRDITDWMQPRFNDDAWPAPAVFGVPPVAPWNHLEKRPIPQWKNSGLKPYVSVETTTNKDGSQMVNAHLPYDSQVTPFLKVRAPAGQRIDIRTDDYMGGGPENVRSVYITREGVQEFESLGWMNGHEVHYTAPASVKFLGVKYRETGYNAEFVGAFHCNDEALNKLWEKARRTLYVTMRDNYMDCPDRERAQWWGDMVNELGENFYVFDSAKGPLLARKGILELARWQRPDHTLYSPIPSAIPKDGHRNDTGNGNWYMELPPQMLASVGKYGFWTYYFYTGDQQTIAEVYPHVRDYLNVWKLNEDGLVIHRPGDWDWEDWGDNIDAHVMDSAWYYLALQGSVNMANLAGPAEDTPLWQSQLDSIPINFNAKFWTGKEYRSSDYHGDTDDRANALAVVSGLAGRDKYGHLKEVFAKHYNASPYMEKYVLEALYKMNAPDQAMQRMKQRWASQIASPLTTLWEMWGVNGRGDGTYNHAWSGGALTVLSQYAAGVAPDAPAFTSYHVLPQMGALTSIQSVVPTPEGEIQLDLRRKPGVFELTLTSPGGTTASVGIPKEGSPIERVELNGKKVWPHVVNNIFFDENERYIRFQVKPGKWHFKAFTE
jgi:alpha-L-rhamnosidase